MDQAQQLKDRGNEAFRAGQWRNAEDLYSDALSLTLQQPDPQGLEALFNNRAASRLKLQDYAGALQDCEAALAVNQSSTKALYRRAQALLGVGGSKVSEAVKSLQLLIKSEPNNKDVLQLLQEALKQQAAGQGRAIHLSPHSTASIGIQGSALPASLIPKGLQPHEYEPAQGGQPGTNLLILLHGLGDKPQPYAALARRMALPQTAGLALSGPLEVPETDGGKCWYQAIDEGWEPIQPRQGETRRTTSLAASCAPLRQLIDGLVAAGHWPSHRIFLLGFSQGGTTALEVHRQYTGPRRLGGCISIAGALLEEVLHDLEGQGLNSSQQQEIGNQRVSSCGPVLITLGSKDDVTGREVAERTVSALRTHHGCKDAASLFMVPGKGHQMLGPNQEEVRQVMAFFGKTLQSAAPPGAVEVQAGE